MALDPRNLVAVKAPTKVHTSGGEELVRSIISDIRHEAVEIDVTARGNVKVLALTSFLFGLITAVQWYFGGVVTKSNALLADCHCMLVDALSYFLNIFAELAPARLRTPLRLTVPVISLMVLAVLTGMSVQDAVDVLHGNVEDDDVNPRIVWSFGLAGMSFDVISMIAFWQNRKRGGVSVNMLAALMHVGADFIRSTTTTLEGTMLFVCAGWNGDLIDAVNTLVITVLIYLGILYGLYEVIIDVRAYLRAPQAVEKQIEDEQSLRVAC